MATTLQLPYNVQRGASPVYDSPHSPRSPLSPLPHSPCGSSGSNTEMTLVQSSLMKKGAHLSRIIIHQSSREGCEVAGASPKWSHSGHGSLPNSRSPSPRRPLTRQSSSSSSRKSSLDEDGVAMVTLGSSPNTLGVASVRRRPSLSPSPSFDRPMLSSPRLDKQMSLERSDSQLVTESEEIGGRSDELAQAMGSMTIGKRKEATKAEGLPPAKRPKTVAEYAKNVHLSPLLLSPNPDAEALLTCLGFGAAGGMPFSAPPYGGRPGANGAYGPGSATHSMEALAARGLPDSVLGKRNSAPPVMVSAVAEHRRQQDQLQQQHQQQQQQQEDDQQQSSGSLNKENSKEISVSGDRRPSAAAMGKAMSVDSGSHRPLRRTDSDLQLLSPATALGAGPTPAVLSPTKYVAKSLRDVRMQRRRSLQNIRQQQAIPEGSQESLLACNQSPSPSPMFRQDSMDGRVLEAMRTSLEDSGAFVFSGATLSPPTTRLPSRDPSPMAMRKWHSFDSYDSMDQTDGGSASVSQPGTGSGGTSPCTLSRQSSGSSLGSGSRLLSRSPSREQFSAIEQLSALDDSERDREAPVRKVSASGRAKMQHFQSLPSFTLNDSETQMDVDSMFRISESDETADPLVKGGRVTRAESKPFEVPLRHDEECRITGATAAAAAAASATEERSMSDAAKWAGLALRDPYSYDMYRMVEGYSWGRVMGWNRFAAESGQVMPQGALVGGAGHPYSAATSGAAATGPGGKTLATRSQSLIMPSGVPMRTPAGRTQSLVAALGGNAIPPAHRHGRSGSRPSNGVQAPATGGVAVRPDAANCATSNASYPDCGSDHCTAAGLSQPTSRHSSLSALSSDPGPPSSSTEASPSQPADRRRSMSASQRRALFHSSSSSSSRRDASPANGSVFD